jgi:hypothetical protein
MENNIIWIVGGVDKGNDYSELFPVVKKKVKAIVCLGKDNKKIIEAFKDKVETIVETTSMEEAVRIFILPWQRKVKQYFYHRHVQVLIFLRIMKTGDVSLNRLSETL